jgi:hypothetical protein
MLAGRERLDRHSIPIGRLVDDVLSAEMDGEALRFERLHDGKVKLL